MFKSYCLCKTKSIFKPVIKYKNETVFKQFNGVVIGRCQNCGLLKTVVQPENKFNPETTHAIFYEEQHFLFLSLFQPIVDQIKALKPRGSILDVGCSSGILLEMLVRAGFNIRGIEPNEQAYQIAAKKFPGKIFYGYFGSFIKNNNKKFDVIIYNHVFEHIEKLNTEINLAKTVLKQQGLLVIGVPNTNNIIFWLRQKYWEYLVPLEHVWHFSNQYLVKWLKKNNFQTVKITFSDDPRADYPLFKKIYFRLLSLINKLFATGELMLIISKKNETIN